MKQAAGGRRLWSLCGRLLQPRLSVRHRDFVIDRGRHAEFTQSVRGVTYLQLVQPQQLAIRAFDAVGVRPRGLPSICSTVPLWQNRPKRGESAMKIITTMMAGAVVAHLSWMQPAQAQGSPQGSYL